MKPMLDRRNGLLAMLLAAMFVITACSGIGLGTETPSARATLMVDGGEYYEGLTRIFLRDDGGNEKTAFALDETVNVVVKVDRSVDTPANVNLRLFDFDDQTRHINDVPMVKQADHKDGTSLFTLSFTPNALATEFPAVGTNVATPDWYYLRMRGQGGQADFEAFAAVVLGNPPSTRDIRTFSDSGRTVLTNAFDPGDTVYFSVNLSGGDTADGAESEILFFDYFRDEIQNFAPTIAMNGDTAEFEITLPNPSAVDFDNWYFIELDLRNSGGSDVHQGAIQVFIQPATPTIDYLDVTVDQLDRPANAEIGETDVVMAELDVSTTTGNINIRTLTVAKTGTAPDGDVAQVRLFLDDGDGTFNGADTEIATGTFSSGSLTFSSIDLEVTNTEPLTLFVIYDMAGGATAGNTVGCSIVGFDVSEPDTVAAYSETDTAVNIVALAPDALDVAGSDMAPAIVNPGQNNVALYKLTFSTTDVDIEITSIKVDQVGNGTDADTDVVELHQDDGDGVYDPADDGRLGDTGAFAGNTYTFTGLSLPVTNGNDRVVFVVVDIDAYATIDNAIGVSLVDQTYVGVSAADAVNPFGPLSSTHSLIRPAPPSELTVGINQLAPVDVWQGERMVPFAKLHFTVDSGTVIVEQMTIRQLGTAADADVETVNLFMDSNGNGEVDANEGLIAGGSFTSGTVTFLLNGDVESGSPVDLLVVLNISAAAIEGNTISMGFQNANDLVVSTEDSVNAAGFPKDGGIATVKAFNAPEQTPLYSEFLRWVVLQDDLGEVGTQFSITENINVAYHTPDVGATATFDLWEWDHAMFNNRLFLDGAEMVETELSDGTSWYNLTFNPSTLDADFGGDAPNGDLSVADWYYWEISTDGGDRVRGYLNIGNTQPVHSIMTYSDPDYSQAATSFSSDQTVYVEVFITDGTTASSAMSETHIMDYQDGNVWFDSPALTQDGSSVRFSVDLKDLDPPTIDGWWYTVDVSVRSMFMATLFEGAAQIRITQPVMLPAKNLTVTGTSLAPVNVSQGQLVLPMESLALSAEAGTITLNGLSFHLAGTGNNADVDRILLFRDEDEDGVITSADSMIADAAFDASSVDFDGLDLDVTDGNDVTLIVALNIAAAATTGYTVGLSLHASGLSLMGNDMVKGTFPMDSGLSTIVTGTADMLNVAFTDLVPAEVHQGDVDVHFASIQLDADNNSVTLASLKGEMKGNDAADLSATRLYLDSDMDGEIDLRDSKVAEGVVNPAGKVIFDNLYLTINAGTPVTLILAFDIAVDAGVDNKISLEMVSGDLTVGPLDTLNVTLPFQTGEATVKQTNFIKVSAINRAPTEIGVGDTVPVLQLKFTASAQTVAVNNITVSMTGTASDEDIQGVRLYNDLNGNGVVDVTDPILGNSKTPKNGIAKFVFIGFAVPPSPGSNLLVALSISDNATVGETIGVSIASTGDIEFTGDGRPDPSTFPLSSSLASIYKTIWHHLNVTATDLAPVNAAKGQLPFPMMAFHLESDTTVTLTDLNLTVGGNATASELDFVYLYEDDNGNGMADQGEAQLAKIQFTTSPVSITDLTVAVTPDKIKHLLFMVDIKADATVGTKFYFELPSTGGHIIESDVLIHGDYPFTSSNVTIGPTNDLYGPLVSAGPMATPNPTDGATEVTVTATLSDLATGRSLMAGGEYWIGDEDPGRGEGVNLTALDGTFDAMEEMISLKLDMQDLEWSFGVNYTVNIRGRDARENWGEAKSVVIVVNGTDITMPTFEGLATVNDPGTGDSLVLSWNEAKDMSKPIKYRIYRTTQVDDSDTFTPSADNMVFETQAGEFTYTDTDLIAGTEYFYMVRAVDGAGNIDTNTVVKSNTPEEGALDDDGDGMPNDWEEDNGFDPDDPSDADADADQDGLTNLEEYEAGSDPTKKDSDGDGLSDGDEVNDHGTDPAEADSDGDGLSDGDEINDYGTDPNDEDSDGDGIPDGWEVDNGLDPTDEEDAEEDPDGDGYSNLEEYEADSDPQDDGDIPGSGDENEDGSDDKDDDKTRLYVGIFVAIVIVILMILLFIMINKKGKDDEEEYELPEDREEEEDGQSPLDEDEGDLPDQPEGEEAPDEGDLPDEPEGPEDEGVPGEEVPPSPEVEVPPTAQPVPSDMAGDAPEAIPEVTPAVEKEI